MMQMKTFDIIVNSTPESNIVSMSEVCDDKESGSDVDGSSKFDLTLLNDDILGADQVARGSFKSNLSFESRRGR